MDELIKRDDVIKVLESMRDLELQRQTEAIKAREILYDCINAVEEIIAIPPEANNDPS